MSYLLDKKIKRKKVFVIASSILILLALFYFRLGILNGLSYVSHIIFRPVLVVANKLGEKFSSTGSYFVSKDSLYLENAHLKSQLNEDRIIVANYNSVLAENINLKEILGRKEEKNNMTLAAILSKPNQSLYDMLIIDAGIKEGIKTGDMVFAFGVPIGGVANVYQNSSKVILFSNSGERTQAVVAGRPARPDDSGHSGGDVFIEVVGRGGGNFEMIMPRDFSLVKGDQIVLPGINPYVLGIVETIISDPRDPFVKALLTSPVNIQELKFVQVKNPK